MQSETCSSTTRQLGRTVYNATKFCFSFGRFAPKQAFLYLFKLNFANICLLIARFVLILRLLGRQDKYLICFHLRLCCITVEIALTCITPIFHPRCFFLDTSISADCCTSLYEVVQQQKKTLCAHTSVGELFGEHYAPQTVTWAQTPAAFQTMYTYNESRQMLPLLQGGALIEFSQSSRKLHQRSNLPCAHKKMAIDFSETDN